MQVLHGANDTLARQYNVVRQYSCDLCEPLAVDDYGVQPVADVSPPKWHLAHTTWFFETFLLKQQQPGYRAFHDAYEYLFNSYYNGIGAQFPRAERGHLSRPTVADVYAYREHVDSAMNRLLADTVDEDVERLVVLGLHHEQQHQELLASDIKYILGQNPLAQPYVTDAPAPQACHRLAERDVAPRPQAQNPAWETFAGGLHQIGRDAEDGFSFDNETPRHSVFLAPFKLSRHLVRNAEYAEFIAAGGYEDSRWWLSDGWTAVQAGRFGAHKAPLYWRRQGADWYEYALQGLQPLAANAPVSHLSYFEADAFARWKGYRLPTECEWEVAATSRRAAFYQLTGSRWQWTASAYLPYPGYQPLAGTVGEYNGKFMSGQMVLRGGSAATPEGHERSTYRNFFYPADRWQFTGLRLAADAKPVENAQ